MKIKRFNESLGVGHSKNLSVSVAEYIQDFDDTVDLDIPDWINTVSKQTKLDEYKNVFTSTKKSLEFANNKNLESFKKYVVIFDKFEKLEKVLNKLEKNKEILYTEASSELLYKFQEDLINKDPENFWTLFLDECSSEFSDIERYGEVHPDIYKKYKNEIEVMFNMKKYNL